MMLLNECKPKYERLDEIMGDALRDIKYSSYVTFIVDVKEVIKKYFRPDAIMDIPDKRLLEQEISSDIINMIGHYRNYLAKIGKYSSFYFLYSFDRCAMMEEAMPGYKSQYYQKYFLDPENADKIEVTKHALAVCQKVINSIPNCSFIDTSKCDEAIAAEYIIKNKKPSDLAILLSNDPMMYQLLVPGTILLNMKGIRSEIATDSDAAAKMSGIDTKLSARMIPLIVSLAGNDKYGIPGIPRVAMAKAIRISESLIAAKKIEDAEYVSFPIGKADLNLKNKMELEIYDRYDELAESYKAIRADGIYYACSDWLRSKLSEKRSKGSKSQFLELNAKIFNMFPLQLTMIMAGERME